MKETDEESAGVIEKRDAAVIEVLKELRRLVRQNDMTQRDIEKQNGYARGYLSQVLNGHMSLTARHVLAILFSLDVPPGNFFSRLFPDPEGSPFANPYPTGYGAARAEPGKVLSEIRQQMARYDSVIEELQRKGIVSGGGQGEGADRPAADREAPAWTADEG